jgi:hypothetical protein
VLRHSESQWNTTRHYCISHQPCACSFHQLVRQRSQHGSHKNLSSTFPPSDLCNCRCVHQKTRDRTTTCKNIIPGGKYGRSAKNSGSAVTMPIKSFTAVHRTSISPAKRRILHFRDDSYGTDTKSEDSLAAGSCRETGYGGMAITTAPGDAATARMW